MFPTVLLQERLKDYFFIWNFVNIKFNQYSAESTYDHPQKIFEKTNAKWLHFSFWFSYETDILNKLSTNHYSMLNKS